MDQPDGSRNSGRGRRSKVARLIEEYDLISLGDELEQLWTADEDRYSLRELAAYFNQEVLRQQLELANVQTLEGETENMYRLLTADDVSTAERTRVERRLEREGIDPDALEMDFVSYQAIRTYLKEYREADYSPTDSDPVDRELENIQQLRGRTSAVTEGKLEQLRDSDHIILDEFRTLVDIQVVCEGCNTRYDVAELLSRGACDCSEV